MLLIQPLCASVIFMFTGLIKPINQAPSVLDSDVRLKLNSKKVPSSIAGTDQGNEPRVLIVSCKIPRSRRYRTSPPESRLCSLINNKLNGEALSVDGNTYGRLVSAQSPGSSIIDRHSPVMDISVHLSAGSADHRGTYMDQTQKQRSIPSIVFPEKLLFFLSQGTDLQDTQLEAETSIDGVLKATISSPVALASSQLCVFADPTDLNRGKTLFRPVRASHFA